MEREERQAIYQVSTLQALARGNYYGSTDMETLLLHGDTGLGTFHAVAGELIVIDGHAYRVLGDGSAVEAAQTDTTPFATVTWLRQQEPVLLKHQPSIEALKEIMTEHVRRLGINDVYIVRIDGHFRRVSARTDPDGRAYGRFQFFGHDRRQSFAAPFLQALHGQDKGQGWGKAGCFQLTGKGAQLLGADGDDADIGSVQGGLQVRCQRDGSGKAQVFVLPGL